MAPIGTLTRLDGVAELCRSAGLTVRQPDEDDDVDTCDECGAPDGTANSIVGPHHLDTCSAHDTANALKERPATVPTLPARAVEISDDESETLRALALSRLFSAGVIDVSEVGGAVSVDVVPAGDGTDAALVAVWVRVVR